MEGKQTRGLALVSNESNGLHLNAFNEIFQVKETCLSKLYLNPRKMYSFQRFQNFCICKHIYHSNQCQPPSL